MEELLREIARYIALALEAVAVAIVAYGALDAVVQALRTPPGRRVLTGRRKTAFVHLGAWLVLGLEFELAADVVRTVIAPTWAELGELAAIAVIRTFLNYFLERDLERLVASEAASPEAATQAATERPVALQP